MMAVRQLHFTKLQRKVKTFFIARVNAASFSRERERTVSGHEMFFEFFYPPVFACKSKRTPYPLGGMGYDGIVRYCITKRNFAFVRLNATVFIFRVAFTFSI